jgi:hypothetical protein
MSQIRPQQRSIQPSSSHLIAAAANPPKGSITLVFRVFANLTINESQEVFHFNVACSALIGRGSN